MATTNWFITGTSTGLGRLMVEQLLARGDRVAATLRNPAQLDDLRSQYGDRLWVAALDVTDHQAIRRVIADAHQALGRLDVVVSNAGFGVLGAAEEASDEQIDQIIATNLTGSIQLIRAALPLLRGQGGGHIIQVSSEGGQMSYPGFSLYHATKWGIEGFVDSVAQEVAPFNIRFTLAEPGPTATQFGASLVMPQPMAEYVTTPAGIIRDAINAGKIAIRGDAQKVASAMISAADSPNPPLRLALGETAFTSVSNGLSARLAMVQAGREISLSTDID
ncbi:short-chain dehydrogenase/reductase [Izhakiella australiensis]|uniref:Short-chain dehydrogenase/reductase n=1 Tax=Izhakiella australiensis TaxID=1926881 RepID=A0A1S8YRM3_9GAMM|nr:SDR family oxidoreductase [Izhakiella australiensis]OON41700.1 short-chain dehydrogenase/reductase [Izhakiella australiensis]